MVTCEKGSNSSQKLEMQSKARETVFALAEELPYKCIEYVDDNVAGCLPPGSHVKSIRPSGEACRSKTAAIETEQLDGKSTKFFLRISHTDIGRDILRGEFASMTAIHRTIADFVPATLASGSYSSNADVHFNLFSYVNMTGETAKQDLPEILAEFHAKGISPNGKYGFSVPTCQGALLQPNTWTSSWEKCFSNMLQRCFDWEQDMHGKADEMQQLFAALKEKVIPRLLRPLETGGRQIKPCLVHGNLWDGNTSVDASTNKPVIFDASSSYAHHEFELGAWNISRHRIHTAYMDIYFRNLPASQPKDDKDDRLVLYRLRFNLTSSSCYLWDECMRDAVIQDMRYLVTKYPEGYQGSEPRKAEATREIYDN